MSADIKSIPFNDSLLATSIDDSGVWRLCDSYTFHLTPRLARSHNQLIVCFDSYILSVVHH